MRLRVNGASHKFLHRIAAPNANRAKFEMGAFLQRHFQFEPRKSARRVEREMLIMSALFNADAKARDACFCDYAGFANLLAFRHNRLAPNRQGSRLCLSKPAGIAIAPILMPVRWKNRSVRHQPSPRHSLQPQAAKQGLRRPFGQSDHPPKR